MCRFLSLDFEYTLKCPIDKHNHTGQMVVNASAAGRGWAKK